MKNQWIYLHVIIILAFSSCNEYSENIYKEYYENDTVMLKCIVKKPGDSICKVFYPDGSLYMEYKTLKGKIEGIVKEYYQNGKLSDIAIFHEDKQHGVSLEFGKLREIKYKYFYDNGKLKLLWKYYIVKNHPLVGTKIGFKRDDSDTIEQVGRMVYDTLWQIKPNLSIFYDINAKKDTVNLGETFHAEIKVYNKDKKEKHFFCLGEFDDNFDPISTFDTVEIKNKVYHYTEKPKQTGINEIRGIILYKDIEKDSIYIKTPVYYNYVVVDHSKSVAGYKISAENIPDPGLVYGDESCWGGWFVREPIHEHQPDYSQNFKHRKKYFAFLLPGYFIKYNFAF